MGIPTFFAADARHRDGTRVPDDRGKAQTRLRRAAYLAACLILAWAGAALADSLRIATFAAPLSRNGPGLLLRDLLSGDDPQIAAILGVIAQADSDILLLTDFDYDLDSAALAAFTDYPHKFALRPNTGLPTELDVNGNARLREAADAQGWGKFAGDGGIAILSRYPVADVRDLSALLWRDAGTRSDDPAELAAVQRLSTTGHWIVTFDTPLGSVTLLAFSATPPVFDGPEDRNGRRNADELQLWTAVLDGAHGPPPTDFIIAGNANLDPDAGQGLNAVIADFLRDPRLQDPLPDKPTADWPDGPGKLRVDYVLPAAGFKVIDAGIVWPPPEADSPHALVWVDIAK